MLCLKLVESVLAKQPGGERIINEYKRTRSLVDESRRKMVNILAAHMTEKNGYVYFCFSHQFSTEKVKQKVVSLAARHHPDT